MRRIERADDQIPRGIRVGETAESLLGGRDELAAWATVIVMKETPPHA